AMPRPGLPSREPEVLAAYGLTHDLLRDPIVFGERTGRDAALAIDPSGFAGFSAWAMRVRAMTVLTAPLGWTRGDVHGQRRIVSPDRRHAIQTCGGDERTGKLGFPFPRAATPRGSTSLLACQNNATIAEQLRLPGFDNVVPIRKRSPLIEHGMFEIGRASCRESGEV